LEGLSESTPPHKILIKELINMLKGFITNLGKYNEGELIGKWIDFPITDEELEEVFKEIGINEEYEEIFFTDWESDFETGFGEYVSIEDVNELAEELEALDAYDLEKVEALIEAYGYSLREAIRRCDNAIFWSGYTLEDLAYELVEECYPTKDIPEIFTRYFDYEAFARDLDFDGYTEVSNGVILDD
jgi:antirestriction protein